MYLSRQPYTGDGTTKTFAVPFSYLDSSHVKVYIDGIPYSNINVDGFSVTCAVAPPAGSIVMVKRETPRDKRITDYTDASLLVEGNLDGDANQIFFIQQEIADDNAATISKNVADQFDAQNRRIMNLAVPVDGSDAATKDYADGGNLVVCQEQAEIATEQAEIAAAQAGIAATKAQVCYDQAMIAALSAASVRAENIVHASGSGLPNALDSLIVPQAYQATYATIADSAKADTRFQVSGGMGNSSLAVPVNTNSYIQLLNVTVPVGKSLKVKGARYYFNNTFIRLYVDTNLIGSTAWISAHTNAEEIVNYTIGTNNNSSTNVVLRISAWATGSPATVSPFDGWWLDLAIE